MIEIIFKNGRVLQLEDPTDVDISGGFISLFNQISEVTITLKHPQYDMCFNVRDILYIKNKDFYMTL